MPTTNVKDHYKCFVEYLRIGFTYARVVHDDGGPMDFIHLEVNAGYEKITGFRDVVGKKISEVSPGLSTFNPEFIERLIRVAETEIPDRFEMYFEPLHKWLDISVYCPEKEFFVAIIDDITERMGFRSLFVDHSAIMILLDPETLNIVVEKWKSEKAENGKWKSGKSWSREAWHFVIGELTVPFGMLRYSAKQS